MHTYTNAGKSSYNAMTISLRRAVLHGWGYDFNYTLSHAIDNGSSEPRHERHGGLTNIQNAFAPAGLGQRITTRGTRSQQTLVIELPFGKGKAYRHQLANVGGRNCRRMAGQHVITFRTGAPLNCSSSRHVQPELLHFVVLQSLSRVWRLCPESPCNSIRPVFRASSPIPTSARTSCPDNPGLSEYNGLHARACRSG